jgi:hypothetical protein
MIYKLYAFMRQQLVASVASGWPLLLVSINFISSSHFWTITTAYLIFNYKNAPCRSLSTHFTSRPVFLSICHSSKSSTPGPGNTQQGGVGEEVQQAGIPTAALNAGLLTLWAALLGYVFVLAPNQTPTIDAFTVQKLVGYVDAAKVEAAAPHRVSTTCHHPVAPSKRMNCSYTTCSSKQAQECISLWP